jgi:ketosteroid isomerase-like protein
VNADLIRRALAFASAPRDAITDEVLAEVYAPDVVIDMTPGRVFNPKTYRGYKGLREYRDDLYETWDEVVFEAEEFVEQGDDTLVISRMRGRGRGSGIPVDERAAGIWTISESRIVRQRFLGTVDRDEALAELRAQPGR